MKQKETFVTVCLFRRKRKSKSERGIMIGDGDLIIDNNNKPVKAPIWSYDMYPYQGTLVIRF